MVIGGLFLAYGVILVVAGAFGDPYGRAWP
jgi:hypothetical protein